MVPQVHQGQWGLRVHRDPLVSQALLECQVLEKQVSLEYQDPEDLQEPREPLVRKESQAQLDLPVNLVLLVQ